MSRETGFPRSVLCLLIVASVLGYGAMGCATRNVIELPEDVHPEAMDHDEFAEIIADTSTDIVNLASHEYESNVEEIYSAIDDEEVDVSEEGAMTDPTVLTEWFDQTADSGGVFEKQDILARARALQVRYDAKNGVGVKAWADGNRIFVDDAGAGAYLIGSNDDTDDLNNIASFVRNNNGSMRTMNGAPTPYLPYTFTVSVYRPIH